MRAFNLHTADFEYPVDNPPGYRRGHARVGEAIGSNRIGGTVYELPPGESAWPYHYELGDEEWMIVLDGRVAVRTPEGEQELCEGDVVCFLEGPDGAHSMVNRGVETAHVLMLSTCRAPAVAVYPDSGKVGVFSDDPGAAVMVRRSSTVDYWDGESSGVRSPWALAALSRVRMSGAIARVSHHPLETRTSNVGPTPSRGGKTDVRPSAPAKGVAKGARTAQDSAPAPSAGAAEVSWRKVARRPLQDTCARKRPRTFRPPPTPSPHLVLLKRRAAPRRRAERAIRRPPSAAPRTRG